MALELYVANYPKEFSGKDILNQFKDYKGIKLKKIIQRDGKYFSFLLCEDMEQAISIIEEKHNSNVCGRKMIVRASNKDLQSYIELLLKDKSNKSNSEYTTSFCAAQIESKTTERKKYDFRTHNAISPSKKSDAKTDWAKHTPEQKSFSCELQQFERSSHRKYLTDSRNNASHQQKFDNNSFCNGDKSVSKNGNHFTPLQVTQNVAFDQKKFDRKTQNFESPINRNCQTNSKPDSSRHQNTAVYSKSSCKRNYDSYPPEKAEFVPFEATKNEKLYFNKFSDETDQIKSFEDCHALQDYTSVHDLESSSSGYNSEKGASPIGYTKYSNQPTDGLDEFGWVTVANFPEETTIGDLYRLFTDYNPLKVYIRYDLPAEEDLTQALVCFIDQETADDVILNFDNTLYYGQILLVSDVVDSNDMSELLVLRPA